MIIERMLPGVIADGRWFWPQVRRAGICWWLCGAGAKGVQAQTVELELLDGLVIKLAQSALAHLRHFERTGKLLGMPGGAAQSLAPAFLESKMTRRLTDEAVFWYAVQGAQLPKLHALVRTGTLGSEPGLRLLMEHKRSSEPAFIKKNAFYVLSMHRYHLAAALFSFIGCHEEAAQVIVKHMRDPQLLLLLLRRHTDILSTKLAEILVNSSQDNDPWMRVLVAWHTGNPQAARQCAEEVSQRPQPTEEQEGAGGWSRQVSSEEPVLFANALRVAGQGVERRDLLQVVNTLFG